MGRSSGSCPRQRWSCVCPHWGVGPWKWSQELCHTELLVGCLAPDTFQPVGLFACAQCTTETHSNTQPSRSSEPEIEVHVTTRVGEFGGGTIRHSRKVSDLFVHPFPRFDHTLWNGKKWMPKGRVLHRFLLPCVITKW